MAKSVQIGIKLRVGFFAVRLSWDNLSRTCCPDLLSKRLRIIALVGNEIFSLPTYFSEKSVGSFDLVYVTPSDFKIDRTSIRVGEYMNLSC